MKKRIQLFISSIFGGILIGIGGTASLYMRDISYIFSALIFTIGIVVITSFKLNLFTGRVSYFFDNFKEELINLPINLLGNIVGVFLVGIVTRNTLPKIADVSKLLVLPKLETPLYFVFLLGILCGFMVFISVYVQKLENVSGTGKIIVAIMSIMAFVLCGFEHSIADIFYFIVAGEFSFEIFIFLSIVVIGNSVGAILFYNTMKFLNK